MALARALKAGVLTLGESGLIGAAMINDATIFEARRRRTFAVWAVVCV